MTGGFSPGRTFGPVVNGPVRLDGVVTVDDVDADDEVAKSLAVVAAGVVDD